jgi:hypothetical protein
LVLGRTDVCTQRVITPYACNIFNHFKNIPYDYSVVNMVLAKTCKIFCAVDTTTAVCMFMVTYFIAVCFKEILVSAP